MTPTHTPAATLYEDWLARRARLETALTIPQAYADMQRRILDFLLKRYLSTPEAGRPARFPLRTNLFVDRRWIIVNHYLGKGLYSGVRTMEESVTRTSGILKRMASLNLHESVKTPANGAEMGAPLTTSPERARDPDAKLPSMSAPLPTSRQRRAILELDDAVLNGSNWRIYQKIEGVLDSGAELPANVLEWLRDKLERKPMDALIAYEFLSYCGGTAAADCVYAGWTRAVAAGKAPLAQKFALLFALPKIQPHVAEKLRELLGDDSPARLQAIVLLGDLGSLDDVGLMLDLLSLPPAKEDLPGEREALLATAEKLAGFAPLTPVIAESTH